MGRRRKRTRTTSSKAATPLGHLKPEEAQAVLERLLKAHPDLRVEAARIAEEHLGEVNFEDVAREVEDDVRGLDADDLYARAGRHEWGYVEPGEAAHQMVEEAVEPYGEDMKRRMALANTSQAEEIAKGIVLGLYRVRDVKGHPALEQSPDSPLEVGACVVALLAAGGDERAAAKARQQGTCALPKDFVEHFVPEWAAYLGPRRRRAMKLKPVRPGGVRHASEE